jgi:hypothetical protein
MSPEMIAVEMLAGTGHDLPEYWANVEEYMSPGAGKQGVGRVFPC